MSPPAGTIDLGELPRGEQPEIVAGWPAAHRIKRWRGRPAWRVAAVAATTGLVIAATAAAAAPPQSPLTLQFAVPASHHIVVFDEQRLYVFDDTGGAEQAAVVAYRLEDGTVAWRASLPGERVSLSLWDGVLLAVGDPDQAGERPPVNRTTQLDRDSGESLWTHDGWPASGNGELLLLNRPVSSASEDGQQWTHLAVVDTATGSEAWSIEAETWNHTATRLVTLDRNDVLTSYDFATGELLATAPTAAPVARSGDYYWPLPISDSLAFVLEEIAGEIVFSAYDVDTLRRLWTLPGVDAGPGEEVTTWPGPCGDRVCLTGYRHVPQAVDPRSGQTVWSADWLLASSDEAIHDVYDPGLEQLPGYAILNSYAPASDEARSWLIDVATGEPVLDLRQWRLVGSYLPQMTTGAGTLLTQSGPEGTWIGRLRPDLSGIEALGLIEHAEPSREGFGSYCVPTTDRVVCLTEVVDDDTLVRTDVEVWRLRG